MAVHPPFVGPRVSLPSCLSFTLQLSLVMQVPVGSLLPSGSQPSRWGHPCWVEAGLSSIGTKVWYVFSFPFGLFLRVVTALRDIVAIWVSSCYARGRLLLSLLLGLASVPLPATPAVFRAVSCSRLPLGGYATFLAPVACPAPAVELCLLGLRCL